MILCSWQNFGGGRGVPARTKLSNRTTAVLPQENKTRFPAGIPLTLSFSDKDYDRSQCGLPVESGSKYLN